MYSLENKRKGRQLGSRDPQTLSRRVSPMGQRDLGSGRDRSVSRAPRSHQESSRTVTVLMMRFLVTLAGDLKRKTKSQLA